jgi:hypothetical protein
MKTGKSIVELAEEITRQKQTKRDFVADTRAVEMVTVDEVIEETEKQATSTDVALAWPNNGEGLIRMPVGDVAHSQLSDRFKVPRKYYDRIRQQHPDLLATTISTLMKREPQQRMLRTLDGKVRAFLSNKYRVLDNDELFEAIFPVLSRMGVQIVSSEVTERRMYIKFLNPNVTEDCPDLMPSSYAGRENNVSRGGEFAGYRISQIVAGGVISNSEVGSGRLSIKDLDYNCWCDNGCVRESVVKQTHVGRSTGLDGIDASEFFRDETRKLDDAAFYSKIADTLGAMFNADRFSERIAQMRAAKGDAIDSAAAVPQVVEVVSNRLSLTEGQRDSVLDSIIRDGDLTRWGVANAITAVSQKVDDYDRASEMEEMGGKVLELQPRDWNSILADAKRLAA